MAFLKKWLKRIVNELINAKLGLVAFTINFAIVYWVNKDFGFVDASWSGIKGGASAFFLGGIFGRMSERFSELANPWLAYPLGSVIPTILAYSIIFPMHWLTGTPKPFLSTLLPMFQSMFINTPSTIFVLRRGFLRQNQKKPAVKDKIWLKKQQKKIRQERESGQVKDRRIAVLIPTYWVEKAPELGFENRVFDHPTIVDGPSTLPDLLKSFEKAILKDLDIVVLVAADNPETEIKATERITGWLQDSEINSGIHLFDSRTLQKLTHSCVSNDGFNTLLNLESYAGVRNCGLVAAALLKSEIAVFIDDDETIIHEDFFDRIRQTMRLDFLNEPIQILAGPYLYGNELSFKREPPNPAIEEYWPKFKQMNKAFKHYFGRDPRFKLSPFAFGGNLSINRTVFRQLPFDPSIPRGEDIDYVLMARRSGFNTVIDKEISLRHSPPESGAHELQLLFNDMIRFTIERKKIFENSAAGDDLGLSRIKRRDLQPYPGPFVTDDLDEMIAETADFLESYYKNAGDTNAAALAHNLSEKVKQVVGEKDYLKDWIELRLYWDQIMECVLTLNTLEILGNFNA